MYYEPLKKENERVVKENNELHLKLIHLQEQVSQVESTTKAQIKQLKSEKGDMQFLSAQKDLKIQQLGTQIVELQAKLEKVLQKVYSPQANDIVKGLKKEIGQVENIIIRKQEITMSKAFNGDLQNLDPNRGASDP